MKKLSTILYLFLGVLSLSSCGDCEDKTLQVNNNLLNWIPYAAEETVSFINENNEQLSFTISPDEDVRMEENKECITTDILPFFVMENTDLIEFLRVWVKHDEDLLGDRDQLWGIANANDEIQGSGAINNINSPDLIATNVSLNGTNYSEVISLDLEKNLELYMTIYLQKNVGLVAFDYDDSLWILE